MADTIEYTTTGKPHPYHLVRPSIWPLIGALAGGIIAAGALMFMHNTELGGVKIGLKGVYVGIVAILLVMFFWWKDVIFESITENAHNKITETGLRYGMVLFIASEIMFFVAFFWAFFNGALYPTEAIGFVWPPQTVHVVEPFGLPFLMTMILLLSGCTVTWAHHAILENHQKEAAQAIGITALLGVFFLGFQIYEYAHVHFGFTEGIYPSTFFMATGFHGFHVFVGTVFLTVCWLRARKGHFTPQNHFGFEAAAWYWHFVDVVWLFLFVAIYWWGNTMGIDHSALLGNATVSPPAAH
ncbi:MAG: cytochrome c oxidase subunit 3 [Alphaproteobacteria bacterium]|nr:cytochrome c oxidase subunit 3 [Alphaproteobacteria bacterium]